MQADPKNNGCPTLAEPIFESREVYSKDAAIALAEEGCLHATVVHAKKGVYLRPEFHAKSFRDSVC